LKEDTLVRTVCRTGVGRCYMSFVRQITEWVSPLIKLNATVVQRTSIFSSFATFFGIRFNSAKVSLHPKLLYWQSVKVNIADFPSFVLLITRVFL
jgi:hypothetical protein